MRRLLADIRLTAAILLVATLLALNLLAMRGTVQAASEPGCEPMGSVGNETLYFCESDYVACVWDPSPALGAGVMNCEW